MTPERAEELYRALPEIDREAIGVSAIRLVECWQRETEASIATDDDFIALENEAQELLDTFQELTASAIGSTCEAGAKGDLGTPTGAPSAREVAQ